jgi:putative ABC transport system ATP-binding protein
LSDPLVLAVRGLHHAYATSGSSHPGLIPGTGQARRHVLRSLDLTVRAGEVVVLTGASGAGKTTLLTLCGALRSVQEGDLRVLGRDLRGLSTAQQREVRSRIGFIFQSHHLIDALSAGQNVMMSLLGRVPISEAIRLAETALASLDLSGRVDDRPEALSGGEKQRVAVARALVRHPALILADEPTASLDAESADVVLEALGMAARRWGAAVLLVTHDVRVLEIADRRVHLADGVLAEPGPRASRPRRLQVAVR